MYTSPKFLRTNLKFANFSGPEYFYCLWRRIPTFRIAKFNGYEYDPTAQFAKNLGQQKYMVLQYVFPAKLVNAAKDSEAKTTELPSQQC